MKFIKKLIFFMFLALIFNTKADCEDCKKLRDEITKAWKVNIDLTKELRAMTQELLKHSDTIRKLNSN